MHRYKRRTFEAREKKIRAKNIITEDTPLTPIEQKFITQYVKTGSVQEAMKAIKNELKPKGSSRPTYLRIGKSILERPNVQKELNRIMEELKEKSVATAEEVMTYFTAVMRGEIKDQFGLDAPLAERTRAAQEIARRTIDIDNKMKLREAEAEENNKPIQVTLNWALPKDN